MENVILVIHLLLALTLIGVVLLQRSEGGGLGMGGGGGGGVMSGRAAATALGKLTWGLAIAFICTSLALTILATRNATGSSVVDRLGGPAPAVEEGTGDADSGGADGGLLPPSESSNEPLLPDLGAAEGDGGASNQQPQEQQPAAPEEAQVPTAPEADGDTAGSGDQAAESEEATGDEAATATDEPADDAAATTDDAAESSATDEEAAAEEPASTEDEAPAATTEEEPAAAAEEEPAATTGDEAASGTEQSQ